MLNVRLVLKSPSNEGENVILFQTNKTPRCVIYIALFEKKKIFQCQVSLNSNTTGNTNGAGTINPSGASLVYSRVREHDG